MKPKRDAWTGIASSRRGGRGLNDGSRIDQAKEQATMNAENLRLLAGDIQSSYALPLGHTDFETFDVSTDNDNDTFVDEDDHGLITPDHFSMAYIIGEWFDEEVGDCGTCGCVAAFAAARAMAPSADHATIQDAAQEWLELDDDQCSALFFPWQRTAPPSQGVTGHYSGQQYTMNRWLAVTPEEAAAVLHWIADYEEIGEINGWHRITAAWNDRESLAKIPRCYWCGHRHTVRARDMTHGANCARPRIPDA